MTPKESTATDLTRKRTDGAETGLALTAPPRKASLIASMATRYNIEPAKFLETIKATILPKATDEELQAFCMVAHEYGLNPFLKEIHAFPNKSGGITPVVGVDGWASLMNRRPDFDGIEFDAHDDEGKPHSVTARIYIKGRAHPIEVTEYHSECARNTEPWKQMPRRMLRHKALIQCARVAFGFSGIHDEDEARDIIDVTPVQAPPKLIFTKPAKAVESPKPQPPQDIQPNEMAAGDPNPTLPLTPQDAVGDAMVNGGVTYDQFRAWCEHMGHDLRDCTGFADVPDAVAKPLMRSLPSFVAQAKAHAEGGGR